MSERKAGWYWVKWENPGNHPSWCPSWWCEDAHAWWVEECYQEEGDIVEIGPRIPTPDEPWTTVPVKPDEAMIDAVFWAWSGTDVRSVYIDMISSAPSPEDS